MIGQDVKTYIDKSVLCWLATVNQQNEPNVSPKEMFTYKGDNTLLIANIASPNSVENIKTSPNVCVSFVDVFIQKGYKLKGIATLIQQNDHEFAEKVKPLTDLFTDEFPIQSVIEIEIKHVDTIQAPSYFLYPDRTEESQIASAMKTYGVQVVTFNKLKYLFFTLAIFVINYSFGQVSVLKGFSQNHYAKVNLIDTKNNESLITIYNKSDNKKILTVKSDSYAIASELEELKSESSQGIVLYQDFNFDNNEDLAIQTSYSSKGPSYSIFLFKNGNYIFNETFTEIIQNSQGDFDLDKNTKTISTRGNGGCCWHSHSRHTVINGVPKLMSETIEEFDSPIITVTATTWENGKYIKNTIKTIDLNQDGIKEIMSFNLTNSQKRLVLYNVNDRTLNYALIRNDNTVEFYFPVEIEYKRPDFEISTSPTLSELIFVNRDAKYRLYQKKVRDKITEVGIIVNSNDKVFNLKGELNSLKGDLKWSKIIDLDNVFTEK